MTQPNIPCTSPVALRTSFTPDDVLSCAFAAAFVLGLAPPDASGLVVGPIFTTADQLRTGNDDENMMTN